jgi:hypothetical protein
LAVTMPMAWQLEQTCWTVSRPGPAGRPVLAGVMVAGVIGVVGAGNVAGNVGGGAGGRTITRLVMAGVETVGVGGAGEAAATTVSTGDAASGGVAGVGACACAGAGAGAGVGEQAAVISNALQAAARLQPNLCGRSGVVISNFLTGDY